jgi:uncharacterized protein YggL (DUF469 family)
MTAACPVYGFRVDVRLSPELNEVARLAVWNSFCHLMDAGGLVSAGAASAGWPVVIRSEASQATDADREAVCTWAAAHDGIVDVEVGRLVDLSAMD